MIKLRRAEYEDIPRIMEFINTYWKKGHIMGNDRTLFEFQHVRNGEVFYLLAEDDTTHKIYASMGYIPMSYYAEYPPISGTMLLSIRNPEGRLLGRELEQYFAQNIKCGNHISVGLETHYRKMLQLDGCNICKLNHYYILNPDAEYRISHIEHYEHREPLYSDNDVICLRSFQTAEELWDWENPHQRRIIPPFQDRLYIGHRYFHHPYYDYRIYGIEHNSSHRSILIGREEHIHDHTILRIVNYLGADEDLAYIGHELLTLMQTHNYEYIDFYCYGIPEEFLLNAGFILREENDTNIIPNYFDPFVQKNVDIYFQAWYIDSIHVYRGFGDQDRPNHVPEIRDVKKIYHKTL